MPVRHIVLYIHALELLDEISELANSPAAVESIHKWNCLPDNELMRKIEAKYTAAEGGQDASLQ